MTSPTVLVVAKAPVPGFAKTRVARTVGDRRAAAIASAALLDTLDAARSSGLRVVVALVGDVAHAAHSAELVAALAPLVVVPQRGETFGERLAHAHADADEGHGVVQIGMDTPQVTAADLTDAADLLATHTSVLGPAADGGWWLLAVRHAAQAEGLVDVVMSADDTGARTLEVLGNDVAMVRTLRDMDEWPDAVAIADAHPHLRLHAAVHDSMVGS